MGLHKHFFARLEKPKSSLGFKYPTFRDVALNSPDVWLEGKRADDNVDGLWRIHDNLYDFTNFVKLHPGGADWLALTKGTDITEAFEVHHISTLPEKYLTQYFVRKTTAPRNSPFTFKEDGFYKTLKKHVRKELENVPNSPATRSKFLTDLLFLCFLLTALLATSTDNYFIGAVSGILLAMTCIAAHNFFHQRDNFRMYYFDLNLMSSRGWRITHALSHHMYPNTIIDYEISGLEPFLQYHPTQKNFLTKYVSWVYSPGVYALFYFGYYVKLLLVFIKAGRGWRNENYIPWMFALFLYIVTGKSIMSVLTFFVWIEFVSSLVYGAIAINSGHHHPDIFHDGDAPRPKEDLDWGVHQLDTITDRRESTGSHFLVLISFGDHTLHHLFPTLDHGKLEYLYPIFRKTCKEFGLEFKMKSQLDLAVGQLRQLAKTEPNKNIRTLKIS